MFNIKRISARIFLHALLLSTPILAAPDTAAPADTLLSDTLLITGQIVAAQAQVFLAPRSDNWQQQIKWLAPEGRIVKAGALVVSFDNSNLLADIQRREVELRQVEQKAKEELLKWQQELLDARHKKTQAELLVKKAELDAGVPTQFLSKFQAEQYQLELVKAQRLLEQASMNLSNKEKALLAEQKKQSLEGRRLAQELDRRKHDALRMELFAEREGPVLHAMHPWNGRKIAPGLSVQPGWVVAEIPGTDQLEIQAFVNETDRAFLDRDRPVQIAPDIAPNLSWPGRITKLSLQANKKEQWSESRYLEVRVQLDAQPALKLTPGMSVLVQAPIVNAPATGTPAASTSTTAQP